MTVHIDVVLTKQFSEIVKMCETADNIYYLNCERHETVHTIY